VQTTASQGLLPVSRQFHVIVLRMALVNGTVKAEMRFGPLILLGLL
jgi:hypothetical protein